MKKLGRSLFVLILLLSPLVSSAELGLSLRFEHTSFLRFEPINVFVSIHNNSETPFVLDEDAKDCSAHVRFVTERKNHDPVSRISDSPVIRKLKVMPDETQEMMVDISLWYDVGLPDRYIVGAQVDWNGKTFKSNKIAIDVVRGIEMESMSKSMPEHPEIMCRYSIRYWARENSEYLFLCVDDENNSTNYGVFKLGRVIRVFKPVIQVDRDGNVKVIHQSGTKCYTHSFFKTSKDGVRFTDQTYHLSNGEPYPFIKRE